MKTLSLAAAASLTLLATTALAHEFKLGDLVIDHPMSFATAASAMTGAGYLSITNEGDLDDRLIAITADFPRTMLHQSESKEGIANMTHVDGIDIPAGETVSLSPGGYHVMFMGLNGDPFEEGEEIPATLFFENAGSVDIVFSVESRKGMTDTNHSH